MKYKKKHLLAGCFFLCFLQWNKLCVPPPSAEKGLSRVGQPFEMALRASVVYSSSVSV